MLNLIKVEWIKMYRKKIVWISLLVCLIAIVGLAFFLKQDDSAVDTSSDVTEEEKQLQENYKNSTDWKEQMEIQMQLNNYLSDIYGQDEIEVKNNILQYKIDHNLKPYDENTTWDFVSYSFQLIGFLVSVFAIIFATEVVVSEYANKTTKLLYTKPFSRKKIVISKYISSIVYVIILSIFMLAAAFIVGGIYFTFKGENTLTAMQCFHKIYKVTLVQESMLYFISTLVNAIIVVTITFFLSILCKSQVMPLIVSLGILLFGDTVADKLYSAGLKVIRFSILPNLSLANFFDQPVKENYSLMLMIIIVIIHLIILTWGSAKIVEISDL